MKPRMPIPPLLITAILVAAFRAFALPTMPEGFRLIVSDTTGKTWRETGEFALAPDDALAAVRAAMRAQGYVERFDIGGPGWVDGRVLLWERGDEEIILSLWEKPGAGGRTGCSWGLSPKTPPTMPSVPETTVTTTTTTKQAKETHDDLPHHSHDGIQNRTEDQPRPRNPQENPPRADNGGASAPRDGNAPFRP